MKNIFLALLLLVVVQTLPIHAEMWLIQYEPIIFQLRFSEKVDKPIFQIIFNSNFDLRYHFISSDNYSEKFVMQLDEQAIPDDQALQRYEILFNSPLKIGDGRLQISSFLVEAKKKVLQIEFSPSFGTALVICCYLLLNLTVLGHIIVEFMQVYCLIMFKNQTKTGLYHQISKYMLLLNMSSEDSAYTDEMTQIVIICLPLLLIFISGLIGMLMRRFMKDRKTILSKIIYDFFVYNLFVNIGVTFVFSLLFNSLQFYSYSKPEQFNKFSNIYFLGNLFSYFNVVATVFLLYLFTYVLNPKIKQSDLSWKRYLESSQFDRFRKLHDASALKPWYKRNRRIIIVFKRLLLIFLFFWDEGFEVSVLILEFANIFYTFTIRPYKFQKYMNFAIICRLFMFSFYMLVMLGNLYFSIGDITFNYQSVKRYLLARNIIFIFVLFIIFVFVIYETYQNCSNLNYQIRLVKEQDQYKLKITEKVEEQIISKRKNNRSLEESEEGYTHRNRQISVFEEQSKRYKKKSSLSKDIEDIKVFSSDKNLNTASKTGKKKENQRKSCIQTDILNSQQGPYFALQIQKTQSTKSRQIKWKDQSLLAQIMRNQ